MSYSESSAARIHTDSILPVVAAGRIFRRILYSRFRVGEHEFLHARELCLPHIYSCRIDNIAVLHYLVRNIISVRRTGETDYGREVPLFNAFQRKVEKELGLQRNVAFVVFGRIPQSIGINPEYRKITGVARPHPVIGVVTEFPYRRRRCAYKSYIPVYIVCKQQKTVSAVKRFYDGLRKFPVRFGRVPVCQPAGNLFQKTGIEKVGAFSASLDSSNNRVGNLPYAAYEPNLQTFARKFFLFRHGPEAIA